MTSPRHRLVGSLCVALVLAAAAVATVHAQTPPPPGTPAPPPRPKPPPPPPKGKPGQKPPATPALKATIVTEGKFPPFNMLDGQGRPIGFFG